MEPENGAQLAIAVVVLLGCLGFVVLVLLLSTAIHAAFYYAGVPVHPIVSFLVAVLTVKLLFN